MKDEFLDFYKSHVVRDGSVQFLEWLENTDFFTAPASTRYHSAYEGGLLDHSIKVYNRLVSLCFEENLGFSAETITICGLLHDVCKTNFYTIEMRNRKNAAGQWEQYPFYSVDDQLPYGHGEKSVYIISGFMKLSREEAMAIRWHMGGFDDSVKGGSWSMGTAWSQFPLAVLLHIADLQATYLDEEQ